MTKIMPDFPIVYLLNATSAPLDPRVRRHMLPLLEEDPRAGGLLADGRRSGRIVEAARAEIASWCGGRPEEIVFTSSGTEACNLAIKGVAFASHRTGRGIAHASTEHSAVLYPCRTLSKMGFERIEIPVDPHGTLRLDRLEACLDGDVLLVSVALATPEVGTIQPIAEIARIVHRRGSLLHVDACLAASRIPVRVEDLEADLVSFSSHKIRGPRGVGALYVRDGVRLVPLIEGGLSEGGRRGGAEYVAGIAGFAEAVRLEREERTEIEGRLRRVGDLLAEGLLAVPDVSLNGHPERRVAGLVNVSVKGIDGESLLLALARRGIAASSGSSCFDRAGLPSHVLTAMGAPPRRARGSVLFAAGPDTSEEDIERVLLQFVDAVASLRAVSADPG